MANSLTALNPEIWKRIVQDFLNNSLVSRAICTTKCEAMLESGDQVNFPYLTDLRAQSYTQGTDLTVDAISATNDSLIVDQSYVVAYPIDPVQKKQALAKYSVDLARQAAYILRNRIDQDVLAEGVDNASDTVAGGSLTSSSLVGKITDVHAELVRNNGADGSLFAVVDAERSALLSQTFIQNGFVIADNTLKNGFAGHALGFDVYVSNNLKQSVTLTADTKPTAADTFTIAGVTWTCVADGTAASAGEVNVGADIADFKTIIVHAINGTTSSDYVDVSTADRRKLQNARVSAAAFAGNDCVITGYTKLGASENFTAATNVFGTATSNCLFGKKGTINLAIQMYPDVYVHAEPKQLAQNWMTHCLWGKKLFTRDKERVVKMSINA